jgi:hypothetical protein
MIWQGVQFMTVEPTRIKIVEEAKRIENDTLYSAKGHYEAAEYWTRFHLTIGIPTAILSAIAGASALAQFDNHNIIAGFLAIIVAALTAVATFLNPNEKSNAHQNVGNKYNALRNHVHVFCNIDSSVENSEQELIKQLKELARQRDELNQDSPPISSWAYKKAQKLIKSKTIA